MLCILPVCHHDVDRLRNLLNWISELGGCKRHSAVIVCDGSTLARDTWALRDIAELSFSSVDFIANKEIVNGWPAGPNSLFLLAAEYASRQAMPWLFLEPDAIPLRGGWLDLIAEAYARAGRKYLGRIVPCDDPRLPTHHFTGVGVYPVSAFKDLAPTIRERFSEAFDLTTAPIILGHVADSNLFHHLWGEQGNPPTFAEQRVPGTNVFDLGSIHPEAVLFHRNKDHTLISLLRRGLVPKLKRTFIQLGRFGDIILLLPALKYIADQTGLKPRLIVSTEYASVLDGVSYVEAVPLAVHWWNGMQEARDFAAREFGEAAVLQCHGHNWGIDLSKWPSFMVSMHDRTGVPMELFKTLPLVFDRRSKQREHAASQHLHNRKFVLLNCSGHSSPFPYKAQVMMALFNLRSRVEVMDLTGVSLHRIYDILGLMDRAVGTITIDTATLHLAHGCEKPYCAFTQDGWTSSIPRGNCTLEVKYSQTLARLPEVVKAVESWL